MKDFQEELKHVPNRPGVYLMRDKDDEIIYVGKAINLKRRVRSYFTPSSKGKSAKVLAMVEHVERFEYIIVDNEVESLVLESNFIKEHRPKYNILLRDDKQYPYICIPNEKFPRLLKLRQVHKDGGEYFGPFPNVYAVNDSIRLLQRLYGLRTCSMDFQKEGYLARPCLNFDMGLCPAPCVGIADENKYMEKIDRVREILKGRDRDLRKTLEEKMKKAADELAFEKAAGYRDDIRNLDALKEKQQVSFSNGQDADVIAMARGSDQLSIQIFFVRSGKIINRESYEIDQEFQEEAGEVLSSFIKQFYLDAAYIPKEIILESMPDDAETIRAFLSDKRGSAVKLHVPRRGDKRGLIKTARHNAEEELDRSERRRQRRERNKDRGIKELEQIIGRPLERLEAYDISNISGVQNVGSMVVYMREKKESSEYRKFKIRSVDGIDEYASQREMLTRRLDHGIREREAGNVEVGFGHLPSLIIMDGGKGQVNIAEDLIRQRALDIPVIGLVKDDKHTSRAIIYNNKEIDMDKSGPLYKFLYAVQEEVHRFAINYHRKMRTDHMLKSQLDQVPGIGPTRRKALLKAFSSLENIKKQSREELAKVPGMNMKVAGDLIDYFSREGTLRDKSGTVSDKKPLSGENKE